MPKWSVSILVEVIAVEVEAEDEEEAIEKAYKDHTFSLCEVLHSRISSHYTMEVQEVK